MPSLCVFSRPIHAVDACSLQYTPDEQQNRSVYPQHIHSVVHRLGKTEILVFNGDMDSSFVSEEFRGINGRPTVMTPDVVQRLVDAFLFGMTDRRACRYAGICLATLYNFQNRNPEFRMRKVELKRRAILKRYGNQVTS